MSQGTSCKCDESTRAPEYRAWSVVQYRSNMSAFNGYHYQSSDYSAIRCDVCSASWRTKAAYVDKLGTGGIMKTADGKKIAVRRKPGP